MENQTVQPRKENQRNIEIVTTEIKTLCEQAQRLALSYAIEVGRRLKEAKEMLPHGEWGEWLRERVNFSQSSANNFMRLFDEYGDKQISLFGAELNSQTFGNLTYTKALKLLALPSEERESFTKENDVENLSVRELDRLIKERDEALKKAERIKGLEERISEAEAEAESYKKNSAAQSKKTEDLRKEVEELAAKLEKAKNAEKTAKEKLKNIKDNPKIPEDMLSKIRERAEAEAAEKQKKELEKKLTEANEKIAGAYAAEKSAKEAEQTARDRIAELEGQLKMSNPAVIEFKAIFEQTQDNVRKMVQAIESLEDRGLAEKLNSALTAFLIKYLE